MSRQVWAKTHLLLSGAGYLVYRLTGEAVLDIYDAGAYAPLFDVRTCAWNPEMADRLASSERLPRLTWTCDIAGRVTTRRGGADRAGGRHAGHHRHGRRRRRGDQRRARQRRRPDGDVRLEHLLYSEDRPAVQQPPVLGHALSGTGHVRRGRRHVDGRQPDALVSRQLRRGRSWRRKPPVGQMPMPRLAELAAASPPGAHGLVALPYFAGERTPLFDPDAKGLLIGLTLSHTRGDVYRALLEVGRLRHPPQPGRHARGRDGAQPASWPSVAARSTAPGCRWSATSPGSNSTSRRSRSAQPTAMRFWRVWALGCLAGTRDAGRWVQVQEIVRPTATTHALLFTLLRNLPAGLSRNG